MITPVEDHEFDMHTLMAASARVQFAPETLEDIHLAHLAVYSQADAKHAEAARTKALRNASAPPSAPVAARGFTFQDWDQASTLMIKGLVSVRDGAHTRIAALERRVGELEGKPFLAYRGVYEAGKEYAPGDGTTRSGSLWLCRRRTTSAPGTDAAAWMLIVKRGAMENNR
jgi:hypothetical protein